MGKKNKKARAQPGTEADQSISRQAKRELLEHINQLLEKCSCPLGPGSQEWRDFLDVYELVEKVRKKQQNSGMKHFNRDNHKAYFMEWLKKNGVDTSAVSIVKFSEGGHGLKAERELKAAELFLEIPRKIMMTTETAKESCLGSLVKQDRILQAMPNVALALHLLCERATPTSFWMPYIKILPAKYTTPLYFTPEELSHLKGSPAMSDILNQYRNIARQYAYFYKLFHSIPEASKLPIKDFCFDDYRWAVSTVMTRQNQIPCPEGDHVVAALIPLWDMSNHANGQITTDFNQEKDACMCYTLQPYRKHQQVFIFYGARSNAELLLHSGFVYPANQCDRLSLKFGVSRNDPLYGMKTEVLARLAMLPSRLFHLHGGDQPIDSDLLAYLRVFNMNEDALRDRLTGANSAHLLGVIRDFGEFVSVDCELKAWSFLETRVSLLLRAYPTTIEHDETLLKSRDLSEHARLAIQLRLCEKKILHRAQQFAIKQKDIVASLPATKQALLEDDDDLDDAIQDIGINPKFEEARTVPHGRPAGPTLVQVVDVPPEPRRGPTIVELDEDQPLEEEQKPDHKKKSVKSSPAENAQPSTMKQDHVLETDVTANKQSSAQSAVPEDSKPPQTAEQVTATKDPVPAQTEPLPSKVEQTSPVEDTKITATDVTKSQPSPQAVVVPEASMPAQGARQENKGEVQVPTQPVPLEDSKVTEAVLQAGNVGVQIPKKTPQSTDPQSGPAMKQTDTAKNQLPLQNLAPENSVSSQTDASKGQISVGTLPPKGSEVSKAVGYPSAPEGQIPPQSLEAKDSKSSGKAKQVDPSGVQMSPQPQTIVPKDLPQEAKQGKSQGGLVAREPMPSKDSRSCQAARETTATENQAPVQTLPPQDLEVPEAARQTIIRKAPAHPKTSEPKDSQNSLKESQPGKANNPVQTEAMKASVNQLPQSNKSPAVNSSLPIETGCPSGPVPSGTGASTKQETKESAVRSNGLQTVPSGQNNSVVLGTSPNQVDGSRSVQDKGSPAVPVTQEGKSPAP